MTWITHVIKRVRIYCLQHEEVLKNFKYFRRTSANFNNRAREKEVGLSSVTINLNSKHNRLDIAKCKY